MSGRKGHDACDKAGGGCLFLAFALAFSLLGVGGTQAPPEAFAVEGPDAADAAAPERADDAVGQAGAVDPDSAGDTASTGASRNSNESQESDKDAVSSGEGRAVASDAAEASTAEGTSGTPEGQAADEAVAQVASEDEAQLAPQADATNRSFRVPEERYVFEYVYGVIGKDHAVFSDEPFNSYGACGVLVSQSIGQVLGSGATMVISDLDVAITGDVSVAPFAQDGKYGLMSVAEDRVLVEARYDIAGSSGHGSRWGFIQQGERAANGMYPNARAVICEGDKEVLSVPLESYRGTGSVTYSSGWAISWHTGNSSSGAPDAFLKYSEELKLISSDVMSGTIGMPSVTFDGRGVWFGIDDNDTVIFKVKSADGVWGEPINLATDNKQTGSYRIASNIIEVPNSNGFRYQYFTLDGRLLQNSDKSFRNIGNYVTDGVADRNGDIVFLDTSVSGNDARRIPCRIGDFIYEWITPTKPIITFECLTKDNKVQLYDSDLNLVGEFEPTLDLTKRSSKEWVLKKLSDDVWALSQKGSSGSPSTPAVDPVTDIYKGSTRLSHESLGLDSSQLVSSGSVGDYIYLVDDSGSNKLRIYDRDLKPVKTIDLNSLMGEGATLRSVNMGNSPIDRCPAFTVNYTREGRYQYSEMLLDSSLEPTGITSARKCGDYYSVMKEGKYGIVDADLKAQTEFTYDGIWNLGNYSVQSDCFVVTKDGKHQLLGPDFKDALGFSFGSVSLLSPDTYLVIVDGVSHVYTGTFKEVDLQGYRPIEMPASNRFFNSARVLPNGNTMVYARDAQGRLGAVDSAGNVLIPFEYKDFAESAGWTGNSDYILLRDDAGWFFVSVREIQGTTTNPECDANGHDYESVTYQPTCEEDGYVQQVCKRCGHGERVEGSTLPKLGHDYVLTSAATEPTCTEVGKGAAYTCTRCQKERRDEDKPSLGGHVDFDWKVLSYPTCTTAGLKERTCGRCGTTEQQELPALGHAWSAPTWEWADDFSTAATHSRCERGCGATLDLDAAMTHEAVQGGTRHSARVEIAGQAYKDGRLVLGWTGADGIARSLIVKGAPVVDGFTVQPEGLTLPADATVVIDVSEVREGGVFDALVAKMGSGWPGGTFDVRLNVNDAEVHDNFGTLAFSFPTGGGSAGKKATIHHCHQNDRTNITSHDVVVSQDGMALLTGIVDLSTFAVEIYDDETPLAGSAKAGKLAATGDDVPAAFGTAGTTAVVALAFLCLAAFMLRRRVRG
ncbi:MAG: hypothetical protein HFJ75_01225 [Eggerthellaceae bacterium]|nr:hypothetical protein [Eggerthellaceae bacterium]